MAYISSILGSRHHTVNDLVPRVNTYPLENISSSTMHTNGHSIHLCNTVVGEIYHVEIFIVNFWIKMISVSSILVKWGSYKRESSALFLQSGTIVHMFYSLSGLHSCILACSKHSTVPVTLQHTSMKKWKIMFTHLHSCACTNLLYSIFVDGKLSEYLVIFM